MKSGHACLLRSKIRLKGRDSGSERQVMARGIPPKDPLGGMDEIGDDWGYTRHWLEAK